MIEQIISIHSAITTLLVREKMQLHISMPTLVRVLVHITWTVSPAMDMRLPYWLVVVSTLLVGWTTRVSEFMTVHLEMKLVWSVKVCVRRSGFCCIYNEWYRPSVPQV